MRKYLSVFVSFIFLFIFAVSCSISPKRYRIGIDPSFYPTNFGQLNTNIYGYINDVLLEIAKMEKIEFEKFEANWDTLLEGLDADEKSIDHYDFCISLMQPYNFNLDKYCFSSVFLQTGPVLIVPKKAKYEALEDLNKERVGIVKGDLSLRLVQKYPDIMILPFPSIAEMLEQLDIKNIDAAVTLRPLAIAYSKNIYGDQFKISAPIIDEGIRFISLRAKSCDLIDKMDRALKRLEKNKTLEVLQKKWKLM